MSGHGVEWLIRDTVPGEVFTPERFTDEHRLIEQTAAEFVANEVIPALPELDKKNWDVARRLIGRAGALGLVGTDTPEEYGGVGLDKAAAVIVCDAIGDAASFSTTFGAQSGLAIIPILCFGTDAQKKKYLPRITSGEMLGAYCLSESGSGSDALAARAKATRLADGSWSLTGEKLWITGGGFADLFIVFAKVDGHLFSAFIVERTFPGVSTGKEEHKMGLHGSSTTAVILQDARVPADNLLGEVGKGHKIAFNVLNYGRFKLGAMCTGGARAALADAAKYAITRRQFGRPIAGFGAIRQKLADMAVRLYAAESMLIRTAGLLDDRLHSGSDGNAMAAALEEFAIEASLVKVACSEMIDFVVDENVQIHGGNGYVADYAAERRYRDARVNRIFEGTNEINRLLVPAMIIKRGHKGDLPLAHAMEEARRLPSAPVTSLRRAALMALDLATKTWGEKLEQEQEALMALSDLLIAAFAADTAATRAAQARAAGHPLASLHADAAATILAEAAMHARTVVRPLLLSMLDGEPLAAALSQTQHLLTLTDTNLVAAKRRIAEAVVSRRAYPFGARS
ncbi:MAG TPA: acyl-CoA dehydrogenase family protein [Vicinamibacterales bacterium]|nr:acyl-CoA dehydrogenase family protein [Vicinamibacterales bacterium]